MDLLAQWGQTHQFVRGETIWLDGTAASFICVIGTGFVKMVKSTGTGHEITHEIMGPGQTFGFLGAIDGTGCPLIARAVTDCWVIKIPKTSIMPIYERTVALKDHVIRRTTIRLRKAHELVARLSTGNVESRIISILLMLAESYGEEKTGGEIELNVPLTRQDIAEMAGTTVESTIRVMSKWKKDGLVTSSAKLITIHDVDLLSARVAPI